MFDAAASWDMMAGVGLQLGKSSVRSRANEKGIDSLVVRPKSMKAIPTTYDISTIRHFDYPLS